MPKRLFSSWTAADWGRASLLTLLATWLPPMFKSLWVDELGSYWAIKDTLGETILRASQVHGQSPFTYVLMWGWNRLLSPSDFGLRVLPVLFGLGTLAILYSIGKRLLGSAAGWCAVAAAVSLYEFRAMVVNLRPYAFALFFIALSTRLLIAWDDRPTRRVSIGYVLATAATVWSVFYFGLVLIGHLVFVIMRRREGSERSLARYGLLVGFSVLLCLPLAPQLLDLGDRAQTLQFSGIPMMRVILGGLIPMGMVATWLIVVLACGLPARLGGRKSDRVLIGWLLVAPTTLLYLLTVFSDFGLWTVRYRSSFLLGFALASAVWISGYDDEKKKVKAVLVMMVVGLLISPQQDFTSDQDWRGGLSIAGASVAQDGLVILGSGLVEAASLELLSDPLMSQFIAAPLSRYPVKQDVLLAPFLAEDVTYPYLVERLQRSDYDEIAVVSLVGDLPGYENFYVALAPLGFVEVRTELAGRVQVVVYRRS